MQQRQSKITHIIFGLGKSGISCARYFDRIEQPYSLMDTRENIDQSIVKELTYCQASYFGQLDEALLEDCSQLIVSPGISLEHPFIVKALALDIDVCGDVEIFARQCNKKIVAITGSNGKSTVTELTSLLIQSAGMNCQMGGNIGLPLLDFLPQQAADIYVLELSSFQLDTTRSLAADVAVLLNVSEDHMDRYSDFQAYVDSKKRIYRQAKHRIFNWQDKNTYPDRLQSTDSAISMEEVTSVDCSNLYFLKPAIKGFDLCVKNKAIVNSTALNITGIHNLTNSLACIAILSSLKIQVSEQVIDELKNYRGLAHRFQLISRQANCEWIDDSKATNVGATLAAINSLSIAENCQLILIAGGDSKNSDLSPLKEVFTHRVNHLILLGKDAKRLAELVPEERVIFVTDMKSAVKAAKELCRSGDVILLSPACSSLDMYSSFEARGIDFQNAVRECA